MSKRLPHILLFTFCVLLSGLVGFWLGKGGLSQLAKDKPLAPIAKEKLRPLDKYSFESLSQRNFTPEKIEIESEIQSKSESKTETALKSYVFSFNSDGKKVTGQINLPARPAGGPAGRQASPQNSFPVILMLRGYVDPDEYQTGKGTRNAAAFFAQNGFITVAPDFLGYGGSDPVNPNPIEARFETYTTVLNLLASLEGSEITSPLLTNHYSLGPIGLWGHSNGGHIALAVLEITKKEIPTTLWAPVTKPFPYSVLYYTDESEDEGKKLRREIANFEKDYDVFLYSTDNYFDRISPDAPLQLHQGSADEEVPVRWSNEFVKKMKELDKKVTYFTYPGTNHNLQPASQRGEPSWNTAISADLSFFKKHLKQ